MEGLEYFKETASTLCNADIDSTAAAERLWAGVWEGKAANDSFDVLRKAILGRFKPPRPRQGKRTFRRGRFNRWNTGRPQAGSWSFTFPATGRIAAIEFPSFAF